tara:strand:+ start:185 stop:499 length:315 start_codon:yes stop_codon:yes gene_type:complete
MSLTKVSPCGYTVSGSPRGVREKIQQHQNNCDECAPTITVDAPCGFTVFGSPRCVREKIQQHQKNCDECRAPSRDTELNDSLNLSGMSREDLESIIDELLNGKD